ncbi:MAG: DUF5686 and carboxypeptidase regulatory-like domain-containing protein [Cyclobacteriaceae bacterium]
MRYFYLWIIFFSTSISVLGQGVQGVISTEQGQPLAFATIYIPQLETGTTTNDQGYYEIKLDPGTYDLVFQYLGYASQTSSVTVADAFVELNVTLPVQTIQLKEVIVQAGSEDPAYTIIRKAIAKSKYHQMQVQHYTAEVYVKGGGRVKKTPFYLRKLLEKEGVDSSTVFVSESISEITFEQPNTMKERVISVRTSGEANDTSPNGFIYGSFYEPEIAGAISPLSPRAFAYYRFRYEGSFYDRGQEVNKIRVTPRSKGDDVFTGFIYIVDDLWSIHSLNLYAYKQGFKFLIKQIYAPIQEAVWLPVTYNIDVTGKILGFDLEYKYLATVSDYDITLNPDLDVEVEVVDEKIDKELAAALIQEEKLQAQVDTASSPEMEKLFEQEQKLTRKQLRKMLREYEDELEEESETEDIVSITSMTVDSTAAKSDSAYWARVRPVPLSQMERTSYQKLDSLAVVEREEEEKEREEGEKKQEGKSGGGFDLGKRFKLSENTSFWFGYPLPYYNTVEGFNITLPINFKIGLSDSTSIRPQLLPRYAFAREKFTGKVVVPYSFNKKWKVTADGGRFVSQFNEDEPISPLLNTFFTLLGKQNFMKLYEKSYGKLAVRHRPNNKLELRSSLEWAERYQLFNNTDYALFDRSREYTPNAPPNVETEVDFPLHQALVFSLSGEYEPFLKYRIRNERKRVIDNSSPQFRFTYRKGFSSVLSSDVDYDFLEIGARHQFDIGARGRLFANVYAGSFLNNRQTYFMDFRHFPGNRIFIQESDPVGSYRLLDYYLYSTERNYFASHLYYQLRKFLLTQVFEVRMLGLKENIFVNYLKTSTSPHYTEVGYSLDNIFRFFRVEAVASFNDTNYVDFGVRIGISTSLENMFD